MNLSASMWTRKSRVSLGVSQTVAWIRMLDQDPRIVGSIFSDVIAEISALPSSAFRLTCSIAEA